MFKNIKLNNIIETNDQKLRPLKLLFKIQFGQNVRFRNKLIKNWIKNTKNYKRRRQIGFVKPPHPRYHYKRLRPSLKFYRLIFLKFKPYNFLKIKFFFGHIGWLKNSRNKKKKISLKKKKISFKKKKISFKILDPEEFDMQELLIQKENFLSKNPNPKVPYHHRNSRERKFVNQQSNFERRRRQRVIQKIKREYFFKLLVLKSYEPRYNLRGRIFFVNSWINFFHKFNLKKLKTTVSKNNFFNSDLKKFIKCWKNLLDQKIFCIYSLYSFYVFKSVFLKKKKQKKHLYFYNKDNILLISISYNHFSFFINLLYILKLFFNENLLRLYKKKENKKIFLRMSEGDRLKNLKNNIKVIEKKICELLELKKKKREKMKKKKAYKKAKALEKASKKTIKIKYIKKTNFLKFKNKTFFHIFYFYCFFIYFKKYNLSCLQELRKNIFSKLLSNQILRNNLERISFFNFILENNLSIALNSPLEKQKFAQILSFQKSKKNNFNEISYFFRKTILNFFSKEKTKTLKTNSVDRISFLLYKLINKNKNKKHWKLFFVLKKKQKVSELYTKKNYLRDLYLWLFLKNSFNKIIYRKLFNPYNVWLFFINYALNYYLFSKLYFVFLNYFFYIIFQKFNKISNILKLNKLELCYDFIKLKDNSRYHLGIRPHTFVTTFNRRVKKGSLLKKF